MTHTVRASVAHRMMTTLVGPIIGAVLGLVAAYLFEVAIATPWLSFHGLFGFGEYVGEPVMLVIGTIAGALGGIVFSATMMAEALVVTVSPSAIEIAWDDAHVEVPAPRIHSVIIDRDIVILGERDIELARVRNDVCSLRLVDALKESGYRVVTTGDPFDVEFRSEHDSRLCADAQKLLTARSHALRAGAHGDAELLRRRLASRGVMVRDVHRRGLRPLGQQWRTVEIDENISDLAGVA